MNYDQKIWKDFYESLHEKVLCWCRLNYTSVPKIIRVYIKFSLHYLQAWRIFDSGPKSVSCPLVCLPPVSGTADIFYKQIMGLASRGIRVIAAEPPAYWNLKEWCDGFKRLIDYLELDKIHIFGASLGRYQGSV